MLLDEPFAAIDAKVRKELRSWLKELIGQVGITSIFVTHDQEEAIEVADEIIVTNKGRIEQVGSPIDIYRNPQSAFVAQFIGEPTVVERMNRFKGFEKLADDAKAVVRPEYILINKTESRVQFPGSAVSGVVEQTAFRGTDIEVKIRVFDDTVITAYRQLTDNPLYKGDKVKVFVSLAYVLDGDKAVAVENAEVAGKGNWGFDYKRIVF